MSILHEFVGILDGREYPCDINAQDLKYAADNGAVIVFGHSDDMAAIRGAIHDDVVRYGTGAFYIDRHGEVRNMCGSDTCPYFEAIRLKSSCITALRDEGEYVWAYETDIPHKTFDVLECGKKYCQGIVFMLDDVAEE